MFMDREAQHRKDSNSWQNDPLMHFLSVSAGFCADTDKLILNFTQKGVVE